MAGAADTACVEVIIWVGQSSRSRTAPACDEAESHVQQLGYTKERVVCTGIAWGWSRGLGDWVCVWGRGGGRRERGLVEGRDTSDHRQHRVVSDGHAIMAATFRLSLWRLT